MEVTLRQYRLMNTEGKHKMRQSVCIAMADPTAPTRTEDQVIQDDELCALEAIYGEDCLVKLEQRICEVACLAPLRHLTAMKH